MTSQNNQSFSISLTEKFVNKFDKFFSKSGINWFPGVLGIGLGLIFAALTYNTDELGLSLAITFLSGLFGYLFGDWIVFLNTFNRKIRSEQEVIILVDKFSRSSNLIKNSLRSIEYDIEFEKKVNNNAFQLKIYSDLTNLKYDSYLKNHFIFSDRKKCIEKIPLEYFEKKIWEELVADSDYYYSMQLLTDNSKDIYLKSENRKLSEVNYLKDELAQDKSKLNEFYKLFVLKNDESIDFQNKKIKCKELNDYLFLWYETFKDINKATLKVIEDKKAAGLIGAQDKLSDIGIFGDNILGIQSVSKTDDFFAENVIFDFNLDSEVINKQKTKFRNIFANPISIELKDFFEEF